MQPSLAVIVLALLLAACGGSGPAEGERQRAGSGCTAPEQQDVQSGEHLIGDVEPPVPYSSTPPSSGWHSSGRPPSGVASEPLTEPEQVAALENGDVVVTYRDLPQPDRQALEEVAGELHDHVTVTPYDKLQSGQVVFAAWGVLQRCDGIHADALRAFVDEHAAERGH